MLESVCQFDRILVTKVKLTTSIRSKNSPRRRQIASLLRRHWLDASGAMQCLQCCLPPAAPSKHPSSAGSAAAKPTRHKTPQKSPQKSPHKPRRSPATSPNPKELPAATVLLQQFHANKQEEHAMREKQLHKEAKVAQRRLKEMGAKRSTVGSPHKTRPGSGAAMVVTDRSAAVVTSTRGTARSARPARGASPARSARAPEGRGGSSARTGGFANFWKGSSADDSGRLPSPGRRGEAPLVHSRHSPQPRRNGRTPSPARFRAPQLDDGGEPYTPNYMRPPRSKQSPARDGAGAEYDLDAYGDGETLRTAISAERVETERVRWEEKFAAKGGDILKWSDFP